MRGKPHRVNTMHAAFLTARSADDQKKARAPRDGFLVPAFVHRRKTRVNASTCGKQVRTCQGAHAFVQEFPYARPSFLRKRESSSSGTRVPTWMPAFAGMTSEQPVAAVAADALQRDDQRQDIRWPWASKRLTNGSNFRKEEPATQLRAAGLNGGENRR